MAETIFQKRVLNTLVNMQKTIENLRSEVNYIMGYIEDTKLTEKEKKELDGSISKIKSGNTSDFVSWKEAKKELRI